MKVYENQIFNFCKVVSDIFPKSSEIECEDLNRWLRTLIKKMDTCGDEDFVAEEEILNVNFFIDQRSLVNIGEESTTETLIIKKDSTYQATIDDEVYKEYILPKYLRCYQVNEDLKSLREGVCAVSAEIEVTYPNMDTKETTSTGTAFLLAPTNRQGMNYLFTCAHNVVSHVDAEGNKLNVKQVAISFSDVRDIFNRSNHIICKVEASGQYETNKVAEDWAIISFNGKDVDCLPSGPTIIPSPSIAAEISSLTTPNEDKYNMMLVGLCSPCDKTIREKSSLMNINCESLRKMIPAEGHEFSLGWTNGTKMYNIYHAATTTPSCSGSPILSCNIPVETFMEKFRSSDILQKKRTEFKDFIQSQTFSKNVIAVHCGYNKETCKNVGCSVLYWFDAFYSHCYVNMKHLYSEEEQKLIEKENTFYESWKQHKVY